MLNAPPVRHEERTGILLAAGAAVIYGAAYPATAVALRSFSPLGIAAIACTIALPVVVALAVAGVIARPSRGTFATASLLRLAILTGLGGIGFIAAVNTSVSLAGPTVTGFVAPLYAVAAAILAVPFLGERVRPLTLASFALAIAGAAMLAGFEPAGDAFAGVSLAGIAALMFGLYIVLARRWGVRYHLDGTTVTIANLASRGPLLLLIELIRSPSGLVPSSPDVFAVVAILSIALGSSSTANLLLMASVRRVQAGRTSAALLLTPISSAIISVLVLGERLVPLQLVGGALILGGIAGASGVRARRPARPTSEPDLPPVGQG